MEGKKDIQGILHGTRMGKTPPMVFRYCCIGVLNTISSYATFALFVRHISPSLALVLSTVVGIISSYILNSRWTFGSKYSIQTLFRFVIINLFLLGLSELSLHAIMDFINQRPLLAQALNTVLQTPIGFLANRSLVFLSAKIEKRCSVGEDKNLSRQLTKFI